MTEPSTSKTQEPDQPSDAALVQRARSGDPAAFDLLILRHQDRVFTMALRMLSNREDALDLAQEVFLTVFRSLRGFASKARFSTWLYRVTLNRCRDELRRRSSVKHTRPKSLDRCREPAGLDPPARTPAPPAQAIARETAERIITAIHELPVEARETLLLRDQEDLSYEAIAEVLEIPVGTVRSRLNRARTLLKERLLPLLEGGT